MKATSTIPPADYVGRRLGEFVLGEKIGEGGLARSSSRTRWGCQRQVVVKILRSRFGADETTQLRFLREARLASSLDHPYAAHVYAFGEEPDGLLWIAMELVRGTSLADVVRARTMGLRELVPFLERLCEVVHTAHEHGIVHRDIKPQNVMVIARAGALMPKLLDLGIAKDAALGTSALDESSAAPDSMARARMSDTLAVTVAENAGREISEELSRAVVADRGGGDDGFSGVHGAGAMDERRSG